MVKKFTREVEVVIEHAYDMKEVIILWQAVYSL